jgi:hypothetical protein
MRPELLVAKFTAKAILNVQDPAAEKLVTETGFGNVAMGLIGILSLPFPNWIVPAGLAGGLYLGLAGIKHIANKDRTRKENIAMATDLFVALIVGVSLATGS